MVCLIRCSLSLLMQYFQSQSSNSQIQKPKAKSQADPSKNEFPKAPILLLPPLTTSPIGYLPDSLSLHTQCTSNIRINISSHPIKEIHILILCPFPPPPGTSRHPTQHSRIHPLPQSRQQLRIRVRTQRLYARLHGARHQRLNVGLVASGLRSASSLCGFHYSQSWVLCYVCREGREGEAGGIAYVSVFAFCLFCCLPCLSLSAS